MKSLFVIAILLLWVGAASGQRAKWYKGNLHTHSYWSDGDEFPEMIMDWYKKNGYQFIGLSDHNTLAAGEKWKRITKSRLYEEAFTRYLEKFGRDWVVAKLDSGRIHVKLKTYTEYKPLFEDANFLLIQSEEITSRFGDKPIHMNATNLRTIIAPQEGGSVTEVMQRTVDAVLKQRAETGVPMFPHLNHPNFYYGVSMQDIIDLHGERFFEVYNGHPMVHNYGDSLHPGTEEMWDKVNIAYHNRNQPLLFGLATDDSHNYHQFGTAFSNAGRGWVMVQAESLTPESLIRSMEEGKFYASTGVTLSSVAFEKGTLHVQVQPDTGISYTIEFVGVRRNRQQSEVLLTVVGPEARFKVSDEYLFVRSRITSTKPKANPFQDRDLETAWTQPVSASQRP